MNTDKKQTKEVISIRVHSSIIKEVEKIIEDLEDRYAYGNRTKSGLFENAMIRYIDYYWRKRKRDK